MSDTSYQRKIEKGPWLAIGRDHMTTEFKRWYSPEKVTQLVSEIDAGKEVVINRRKGHRQEYRRLV